MLSYYIIPKNVNYVQFYEEIKTWVKTDKIDYNTPTVIVINDSIPTRYTRFVVVYKGLMQTQGGSGSCYNPVIPRFNDKGNPMDNSTIASHMSKWVMYNYNYILQMVISAKYDLIKTLVNKDLLPMFYWNLKYYNTIPSILIAQLDLIGLGKADISILTVEYYSPKRLLLLN